VNGSSTIKSTSSSGSIRAFVGALTRAGKSDGDFTLDNRLARVFSEPVSVLEGVTWKRQNWLFVIVWKPGIRTNLGVDSGKTTLMIVWNTRLPSHWRDIRRRKSNSCMLAIDSTPITLRTTLPKSFSTFFSELKRAL
jgi:hypothetical protein